MDAAAIRRTQVRTQTVSTTGGPGGGSFRSVARIDTRSILSGARPGRVATELTRGGGDRALAELLVAREQLLPGEVLASLVSTSATLRSDLDEFVLRARNRGDLDTAAMACRTLLTVAPQPEPTDVLVLASLEERNGQVALAVNTLDHWIGVKAVPDPRWIEGRERLAGMLPEPAEVVERPLPAARVDARPGLALHVNRSDARPDQVVTLRGQVPAGLDLLVAWLDAEQLAFLWAAPGESLTDARIALDYIVDDPADFVPGDVTLQALSGPGMGGQLVSELEIDLAACARGDLQQLQALQDVSDAPRVEPSRGAPPTPAPTCGRRPGS